MPTKSFD